MSSKRPSPARSSSWQPSCAIGSTSSASRIEDQEQELRDQQSVDELYVTEEDIAQVVSMWTGIPLARIAGEESERLLHMEEALHKRVVGQEEAIATLSKAVRRAGRGSRIRAGRSAASSSLVRPVSGRPSWRRRWPSSCSARKTT